MDKRKLRGIRSYLRKVGCASGQELAARFSLSLRRLGDYLRALGCWTSYSHRRGYYTLPETPRFGKQRIWKSRRTGALFTNLKSLSALVQWHVRQSPAGLTCRELSQITGVRVEPHIVRISRERELVRQKFDGEFVYFFRRNDKIFRRQLAKRSRVASRAGGVPDTMVGIEVEELRKDLHMAVTLLNYPGESAAFLIERLRARGVRVTANDLAGFLIRYGIKKKDDGPEVTQFDLLAAAAKLQAQLRSKGVPLRECCIVLDVPQTHCPRCKHRLYVAKTTQARKIASVRFGLFWMKERLKVCRSCGEAGPWRPALPSLLVAPGGTFAYDVMVFAGERKFLFSQTLEEIRETLTRQYDLSLSPSTLSLYVQEFCCRLECLHYAKLAKLAKWTKEEQLGYMLHVDCSSEHKSDTVFVAYDRTSGIVLVSEKIPSERIPFLVPVLQKVKGYMGDPVSSMSDLGLPIIKALEEVFPGVERRICHFHFLRDVGKDLMDPSYSDLRTCLNQSKINADLNALERDILSSHPAPDGVRICGQGPLLRRCSRKQYGELEPVLVLYFIRSCRKVRASSGFGYPFDLPRVRYAEELCRRALEVQRCLVVLRERRIKPILLLKLRDLLSPFLPEGGLFEPLCPLLRRCGIRERQLAELRKVMRLGQTRRGCAPLSTPYGVGSRREIIEFNGDLRKYRRTLRRKLCARGDAFRKQGYQIILDHVEKYWGNLLLHPSLWRALRCQIVDRTNNLPESGHRNNKQSLRKATGRRRIHREFSDYGPYLPMISNLKNATYIARVLGEYKNLALEFAKLDRREVAHYRERFQMARHGALFAAVRAVSQSTLL